MDTGSQLDDEAIPTRVFDRDELRVLAAACASREVDVAPAQKPWSLGSRAEDLVDDAVLAGAGILVFGLGTFAVMLALSAFD